MPKVYLRTFGCQMNERDSEQVAQMFVERGFTVTAQPDEADVVLLNSCSVRDQAEQKATCASSASIGRRSRISSLE